MSSSALVTGLFVEGTASGASPIIAGEIGQLWPTGQSPILVGDALDLNPTGMSPILTLLAPVPQIYLANPTNGVTFQQTIAKVMTLNVPVSNTVGFSEASEDATIRESLGNVVIFSQIIGAVREINASVSNSIAFTALAQRTYDESVSSGINFGAAGARGAFPESLITFGQQIVAELSTVVNNSIVFDASVATTKVLNVAISNTVNFNSYVVAIGDDICDKTQFASLCLPDVTFTRRQTIIMQCASDTIEIRNPELGNSETIDPKRALNETRYGNLTIYRNPIWPKKTTLEFDLTTITRAKALELHDFLFNCLGQEITLTDYESRIWLGVITNPEALINELQSGDCNYSSNLVFVGEPQ